MHSSAIGSSARTGEWIDTLAEDKRASVPDQVAAKLDVGAWFASLTQRTKQIARDPALGCSTSEVAQKYQLTPGRISQLRRMLEESWSVFQQEKTPGGATRTKCRFQRLVRQQWRTSHIAKAS